MKRASALILGFNDAENYHRRENKQLFNKIFIKNIFLDEILQPSTFFIIGEKGTGKTAYAVYLDNNEYGNTKSGLKYIRETDYQKFVTLKKNKHLQLSDYTSIWKVIILLLLSKSIKEDELDHGIFSKNKRIQALMKAIDEYYMNAFAPEIICALDLIENSNVAAELITKYLKLSGEHTVSSNFHESRFQVNLLYIQSQFEKALADIKIKKNHILFIDGIDIRPDGIPYTDYLECIKGLANAAWSLNNDFFPTIRDSKGRFRTILLLRPDIFSTLGLQNQTNKIRDNSVFLDWRTTYPEYRSSSIFQLSDKLLAAQQDEKLELGVAWDFYFPWKSKPTSPERTSDPSFFKFLRLSYSRPRDLVTMIQILQETVVAKYGATDVFLEKHFDDSRFSNLYSEYLMGGIKDQLSFYYSSKDYEMFLKFFNYLNGKGAFNYGEYFEAYKLFTNYILDHHDNIPEFIETPDSFLQFLYDANIVCYIEQLEEKTLFRWCYRERSPSDISPKVKLNVRYNVHYGLMKALNLGHKEVQ